MAMDLVMGPRGHQQAAAGRTRARRLVCLLVISALGGAAAFADAPVPRITVEERDGVYRVGASFAVAAPAAKAIEVLTDFEQIPRFMPDIHDSRVLERSDRTAVVEQTAVSKFMMFSKRVHLVLDVQHDGDSIRFRDRCGRSFSSYQGTWIVSQHDSLTVIDYQLNAKPRFEVPAFVLKRLLKRDAMVMIERLTAEIVGRAEASK
jgi:ribosome-associated toxin RatA of RatAB toxin-antitoxin module